MQIRTQFPDLFLTTALPALNAVIFNKYDRYPEQYSKIFRVMTSTRSIEQTSEIAGLGTFVQTPEGVNVRYDEAVPGFNKTYTHTQWALGFALTRVMIDDDRWGIINKLASDLGRSAKETIELDAAGILNNGFSGSFLGPDGKALFATDHPLVKTGGTQSNTLAVAADLDIASIELALTDFRTMKDASGKKIRVKPKTLIVAPQNEFAASEILAGTWRSDTANRTVNAFKHRVGMPSFEELFVYEYLTDPDAWFIQGDKEDTELRFYWREKFNVLHDTHFDSRSVKTAAWMRYSWGWSGYAGIYASPGA